MRFGVLGPLLVERDGQSLALGSRRQRAVLARLLLDPNQVVPVARLVDDLWGETPPSKVSASLQAYVSNLRRILDPGRQPRDTGGVLRSRDPGYVLDLTGHQSDAADFAAAATRCRESARAGDLVVARKAGEEALALWRGAVLADLSEEYDFARTAAERLDAERAALSEELLAVRIAAGDHLTAAVELESVVRSHPYRERGWELLTRALYRSGRAADALATVRRAQALLRDDLGVEPGRGLAGLEAAVLRRDPGLDGPRPEAPRATTPAQGPRGASTPAPVRPLIGREDDERAVRELLGCSRLVTVTGPGGVGKTSLALEVARTTGPGHPDGTVFVALAPLTDPALVLPTLTRAVGVERVAGDPFDALRSALDGRRVLVLLDNVEHVLPSAVDVGRLLEVCPTVTVLATGRSPLRLRGEQEYPVSPLPAPEGEHPVTAENLQDSPAARLFLDRVRALLPHYVVDRREDAEAIAAICRRLDGLPLALELAAAWMRVLAPQDLLDRLDQALPLLTGGPRDLPERQRTVRDTVAWSYELLDPAERALFSRLSMFRGSWTLTAAEALTASGSPDADSAVRLAAGHASLLERSLIARAPTRPMPGPGGQRFTMLETVREFGQETLAAGWPVGQVAHRHAELFRHLAHRAERGLIGPDQAAWLEWVGQDHANLRAAMTWFLESGEAAAVVDVAWGIRWFWHIRAFQSEGRRWMGDALRAPGLGAGARARGRLVDGMCAFGQGRWEDATRTLEAACCERADPEVRATAASISGHVAVGRGDFAAAARWAEIALPAHLDLDDPAGAGIAALVPVQVAVASGEMAHADRQLDTAEELLRRAGGSWGIAAALNNRVMIGQLRGRDADLLPLLHESVVRSSELRDSAAFLYGLTSLAEVLVVRAEFSVAARLFGAAEALAGRTGLHLQPPASRALYRRGLERLRRRLDSATLEREWGAGRAMTLEETFAAAVRASA